MDKRDQSFMTLWGWKRGHMMESYSRTGKTSDSKVRPNTTASDHLLEDEDFWGTIKSDVTNVFSSASKSEMK